MSQYWTFQINPVSGCTKISEACQNCYAEAIHTRFHMKRCDIEHYRPTFYAEPFRKVTLQPELMNKKFAELARKRTPQVVFVGNMCDLFHNEVPFEYIDKVFMGINEAPQHTFLILTKRAENLNAFVEWHLEKWGVRAEDFAAVYKHVWLGVTAENQESADERIPLLLDTPAAHRWVSCEPMLGPIDLFRANDGNGYRECPVCMSTTEQCYSGACRPWLESLDWVVCGGESGHRARPMHPEWARSLRDQCAAAGVPFYFKQWGDWYPMDMCFQPHDFLAVTPEGRALSLKDDSTNFQSGLAVMCRSRKTVIDNHIIDIKTVGRLLDGVEHNDRPFIKAA